MRPASDAGIRVVAWNIRAGGGARSAALADQLARWRPDVVLLSEFRATPPSLELARALHAGGLRHQRTTASAHEPAANALLLASRWPIREVRPHTAPDPRRFVLARVAIDEPLLVAGMHVPNRAGGRKDSFHAAVLDVARRWSRGAGLLLGDTNSGLPEVDEEVPVFGPREEAWLRALESSGWRDGFRHLHADRRSYTWYSPNGGNGFRLDQAFLSRALLARLRGVRHVWGRPRGSSAVRESLSDHAAVIVDLALRANDRVLSRPRREPCVSVRGIESR